MIAGLFGQPECVAIRPPLYHPDCPYIVFWSQKSGCTTAVKWFFAQLGLLDEALAFSPWVHDYEAHVFRKRAHYRRGVSHALRRGHKAVKVVRDPMRRAASSFLVLAERGSVIARGWNWTQEHWLIVDAWLAARGRDPARGLSFLDHLAMVAEIEARRAHTINQHISQQYVAGEERFVGNLVPIERFRHWADAQLGLPGVRTVDMVRVMDSGHHHKTSLERTVSLGATPEAVPIVRGAYRDGLFPASETFINERTAPLIRAAYRRDFVRYGALYGHDRTG